MNGWGPSTFCAPHIPDKEAPHDALQEAFPMLYETLKISFNLPADPFSLA